MKTLTVISLLLVIGSGLENPENTDDLWKSKAWVEISKRLASGAENNDGANNYQSFLGADESRAVIPNSEPAGICASNTIQLDEQSNTIIRTKESLQEGTKFILAPANMHSNIECVRQCCSQPNCTLAVFDGKVSTSSEYANPNLISTFTVLQRQIYDSDQGSARSHQGSAG